MDAVRIAYHLIMTDRSERPTRAGKLTFEVDEELLLTLGDARAVLSYPHLGFGGHALVVSADESYLALFLFSGQSEQGWELFELPSLKHLGGLPYSEGEGDAPRFSSDSKWLAMLVTVTPRLRGSEEYFEDVHD